MKATNTHQLLPLFATAMIIIAALTSCRAGRTEVGPIGDTVAASEFAPLQGDTLLPIDLKTITGIRFPKYKIKSEESITPDSVSLSMDEETPASGNYLATLLLDTVPEKHFYTLLDSIAMRDSCWETNNSAYQYVRKDRQGGVYKLNIIKGSRQIILSHLNADMLPKEKPATGKNKARKRR